MNDLFMTDLSLDLSLDGQWQTRVILGKYMAHTQRGCVSAHDLSTKDIQNCESL